MSQSAELAAAVQALQTAVQNAVTQSAAVTPDADVTSVVTAINAAVASLNTAFPAAS